MSRSQTPQDEGESSTIRSRLGTLGGTSEASTQEPKRLNYSFGLPAVKGTIGGIGKLYFSIMSLLFN